MGEDLDFGAQCRDLFLDTLFRGDPANEGTEGAFVNLNPEEGFEFHIEWPTGSAIAGFIVVNVGRSQNSSSPLSSPPPARYGSRKQHHDHICRRSEARDALAHIARVDRLELRQRGLVRQ